MNKFGLIDIFTKLSQDKNAVNLLTNAVSSLFNKSSINANVKKDLSPNERKPVKTKYSQDAIISILKKHEELSKNIDLQNKNTPLDK